MQSPAYNRVHPVTILANLWRVFYLIVIPVLRGFVSAIKGGFAAWVHGAWADILILLLMLALAVWRWYSVRYWYDSDALRLRSGVFLQKQTCIPWQHVVTLSVVESFYLRPFRAVHLRADTLGGSFQHADCSILLNHKQAQELLDVRHELPMADPLRVYTPTTTSIVATSLLTSNSFAGIVFIATFISQAGKLLGNEFTQRLIDTFEQAARRLALGIPPAAAAIAYALLAGWLLAFCISLTRYKNFSLTRTQSTLHITGGIFTQREYYLCYDRIHFVDIRQSLTTKLLHLYSVYISAVGYGKQKDDISCVILTENAAVFRRVYGNLFPTLPPEERQYCPIPSGLLRFIGTPLCLCLAIILAAALTILLFPAWSAFILFVSLMLMLPSILFLLVRTVDFRTCGLSVDAKHYTIRYSKGFYLHTVVIPVENIVMTELRQSPLQRFGPGCDLLLYTRAEGRAVHYCRNMNKSEMQKILGV